MKSDIQSTRLTASGSVFGGPARVVAISYVASAGAGTIQIRDGGASGAVLTTIDTPADAAFSNSIAFGDYGIRHQTGVYVTMTNVGFVTIFYG